jgi:hypothetical protein
LTLTGAGFAPGESWTLPTVVVRVLRYRATLEQGSLAVGDEDRVLVTATNDDGSVPTKDIGFRAQVEGGTISAEGVGIPANVGFGWMRIEGLAAGTSTILLILNGAEAPSGKGTATSFDIKLRQQPSSSRPAIADLNKKIDELGDRDPAVRDAASVYLLSVLESDPELEEFLKRARDMEQDPERRARLRALLAAAPPFDVSYENGKLNVTLRQGPGHQNNYEVACNVAEDDLVELRFPPADDPLVPSNMRILPDESTDVPSITVKPKDAGVAHVSITVSRVSDTRKSWTRSYEMLIKK